MNCVALERMISSSPAVRRELASFELMQIWISDSKIAALAAEQKARFEKEFRTTAIPLHAVVSPEGKILARYTYNPSHGPDDYLEFLARGLERFERP